ncbi:hypothetical protein [Mucilaginibacter pedocola]|uniref:hypothetical protein n=1 Tax=Mucilaginibacter pedocola TaxID=1792845 RepID=UPI00138FC8F1|nr:hypothetical protein [Mucilaginibacter pedocola]
MRNLIRKSIAAKHDVQDFFSPADTATPLLIEMTWSVKVQIFNTPWISTSIPFRN